MIGAKEYTSIGRPFIETSKVYATVEESRTYKVIIFNKKRRKNSQKMTQSTKMNNYHIYEEIGHGKYSIVYKGKKKKSIQYVAVKSVEKNRRKKVINEHRILKTLDHPNILKFYNYYETRNHLWLIFDFCPGGDIYKMLNEDKMFPEEITKHFGVEIMKGMYYLHSNGIIYGDLKPSTILFNEYNELKLADFGRAK